MSLQRKRIILQETKNGERRAVPVAGLALERLIQMEKTRRVDTNLLFLKLRNKEGVPLLQMPNATRIQKVQKPVQIRTAWVAAVKKAEIADFRFHDLRHCAASYLAMSGASIAEIADILGHKTLSMAKRYSHLSDSHKHSVVDRMNQQFLGA